MDRLFMKMMIAQGSIDLIFNAYQRHPAFSLSDEDIVHYCDYFLNELDFLLKILHELPTPAGVK